MSSYINDLFALSKSDIEQYKKKGYIKLCNFFTSETIDFFRAKVSMQLRKSSDAYAKGFFNRSTYDILEGNNTLYDIFADPVFRDIMLKLNEHNLFFTQGIGFELKKNIDKGFPWHTGSTSFGYMMPEDFGCTMWTPLVEIDNNKQKGGMGYIPTDIISGNFMYQSIDSATTQYIRDQVERNKKVTDADLIEMSVNILNSTAMKKLLDHFMVADDFSPGDTFLFNKNVIHRSVMLDEGELESRMAFVMRFIDLNARYNKKGADDIEYPSKVLNYKASSSFHVDIYDSKSDIISESEYFKNTKKRIIK
jgi:hypothetical protein